ncbi:MAG: hypothetical protein ACHQ7N_14050, partial [Candidatus Methylomirabilales bacterium]
MRHRAMQGAAHGRMVAPSGWFSGVLPTLWLVAFVLAVTLPIATGQAAEPSATIGYQPMTSEGLAEGRPFEAWVVFDKSSNPVEPGYALPAGATFRFTFPPAFTPQPRVHP